MTRIERRIQQEQLAQTTTAQDAAAAGIKLGASDGNGADHDRLEPNPLLAAGSKLPAKLGDFPPELYGKPIEELDEYYRNQYVSKRNVVLIGSDKLFAITIKLSEVYGWAI